MSRFTQYADETVGRRNHSVTCERLQDGWQLTLVASPIQPQLPPDGVELTSGEFVDFIRAQSTAIASRRVPRKFVGETEVRPGIAADELVKQILGTAWSASDRGRGYSVELF